MEFHDTFDFRCFMPRFQYFHSAQFFSTDWHLNPRFSYPAAGAVLYELFYLSPFPTITFFVVNLGLISALGYLLGRAMIRQGANARKTCLFLASAMVFSYPFWFEFMLGNLEVCIFLMVAIGVLSLLEGHAYVAAALFGIAGSIKIFPLIYLGLLLARRQYKQAAFGMAVMSVFGAVSVWLVCPDVAVSIHGIASGLALFREYFLLHFHPEEMGFDHSIFGAIKQLTPGMRSPQTLARMLSIYTPTAALLGLVLYFTRIRKLPMLNQILCLTVASIVFPFLSHDYTLIHLYLPWGLAIIACLQAARERRYLPGMTAVFVCFAILMSPQTEFIRAGQSYGGQIKACVLVVLLGLALHFPFTTESDLPAS
jgi:hypothetical protein